MNEFILPYSLQAKIKNVYDKNMNNESKWHQFKVNLKRSLGMNTILCDTCKWNWRSSCHNSARPHATWCTEYKDKRK